MLVGRGRGGTGGRRRGGDGQAGQPQRHGDPAAGNNGVPARTVTTAVRAGTFSEGQLAVQVGNPLGALPVPWKPNSVA